MPGGGPHPQDQALFSAASLPALRRAADELAWLRRRGYALPSALKLVGDRHQLEERQRSALRRATSGAGGEAHRAARRVEGGPAPAGLWADGFNVVITLETALNGGVLVRTVDGTLRDLAGVHGAYRVSEATDRALALLADDLAARGWGGTPARFLLDAPVSNTGRLAARVRELASARGLPWEVEVVPDPDPLLRAAPRGVVVASGDAPVIDEAPAWIDWAGSCVARLERAWIVDLGLWSEEPGGRLPRALEGERLRLRPPRPDDAAWIFRDYAQDPEVTRFLTWAPHTDPGETEAFVAALTDDWDRRRCPWVIERRADGRGLGMFDCRRQGPMAELGYVLAREHWGQGYMSEAIALVRDAVLGSSLQRLWAVCDVANVGSARALEKAGFRREGTLASYCCRPSRCGALADVHLYARVASTCSTSQSSASTQAR
ncbi:MAG: GNAT family N-acetyltransferase [Planctomycetota bacterium]